MTRHGERQHFEVYDVVPLNASGDGNALLPLDPNHQLPNGATADEDLPAMASNRRFRSRLAVMFQTETAYGHGFLFVPVFLIAGAAIWFSLSFTLPFYGLVSAFLAFGGTTFIRLHHPGIVSFSLKAISLVLAGMILADIETRRHGTIMLDTPVTTIISGKVERRELDARGYWRYTIALHSTTSPVLKRPPERVSVLARSRHENIATGDVIKGRARLSPPSGPALTGLNDFAFASYFNDVGATGFFYGAPIRGPPVDDASTLRRGVAGWINFADVWLYDLRSAIANRIRTVIGGDAGAFSASIVTDERRAISAKTMEALRVSGLAHIVAISGLNMALASGIFFVGLRTLLSLSPEFAQAWPVKKIAAFAALLMTLAYYLISGFAVSAERAWLMMSIMLIAVLLDRQSISLRNVAISAIVIVTLSPSQVMGPSFQMSFAATMALVAGYAYWQRRAVRTERLQIGKRPPIWLSATSMLWTFCAGIFVTSLIGGISTAIYSVEHFHRLTTYGLAANLAAMPVMSFIVMPFGLIGMLLMPFGLDAPFLKVMGYGLELVIRIAVHVADWGGDAGIGRQHPWFLGIASGGLLLLTLLRTRLAFSGVLLLAVATLLLIAERQKPTPDLIIFEDGQIAALTGQGHVATNKARPSGFIYQQWQRALLLPDKHLAPVMLPDRPEPPKPQEKDKPPANRRKPMPVVTDEMKNEERLAMRAALTRESGRFVCRKNTWCIVRSTQGTVISLVSNNAFTGVACDVADIVVTSRRTSFDRCRSGAVLLSSDTLRKTGSLAIMLGAGRSAPIKQISAAMNGNFRPWTQHRYYDWRNQVFDEALPEPIAELLHPSADTEF